MPWPCFLGGGLLVGGGSFCGDWVVFALVVDFKEVMLASPSELAHCGGEGGLKKC